MLVVGAVSVVSERAGEQELAGHYVRAHNFHVDHVGQHVLKVTQALEGPTKRLRMV